jgi:hypothetical protein
MLAAVSSHNLRWGLGHTSPALERQNLTLRMTQKRFARLTNGFSKKLTNYAAAVSLYVAHYNLCRVHEALRTTPREPANSRETGFQSN